MTEVNLFILVGTIAVVAAVMMLLTENAVHSALFLILNMGCIAFLFLMLNAPFLAMVQITVYAGAIMVLFLFVIMLLGAEKLGGKTPFRWITPVAMVLALLFLVTAGIVLSQSGASNLTAPPANPQVRVANFAPVSGPVDLSVNGVVLDEELRFGDIVDYTAFPPGDYEFAVQETDGESPVAGAPVTLETGLMGTAIIYEANEQLTVGTVPDDLTAAGNREGRLTLFNAFNQVPAVSLVDFGSDFDETDTQVLVDNLVLGEASEGLVIPENTDTRSWAFIEAGNESNVLARLSGDVTVDRGDATLMVLATDPRLEGTVRAAAVPITVAAAPVFGSPTDVGRLLFSRYMLPMQMVAVLLLVAMVGAIVLTHHPKVSPELERARLGRRRVSRPLASVIAAQVGHDVSQSDVSELPETVDEPAGD